MADDKIVETHPSYAMIRIHRTNGGRRRLFGSPLADHQHTIRITIAAAERVHGLGHDQFYSHITRPITQVEMSAAQFAELITTVNSGGAPCTLRVRDGVDVEDPPNDTKVEADLVREKFAADVEAALAELRPTIAAVEATLAKKALTNADRTTAQAALHQFVRLIEDIAPFMLSQFAGATQRITATAKAEVDAVMTMMIVAAGLKAINEQGPAAIPDTALPALPAPKGTP